MATQQGLNSSIVWAQLALAASPVGSVPFVAADGLNINIDPANFTYDSSAGYLNMFGVNSLILVSTVSAKQGKVFVTPLTGFTYTFPSVVGPTSPAKANMRDTVILTPAGVLATGTVNMPAAPIDGEVVTVMTTQQITLLTVLPGAGQTLLGGAAALLAQNGKVSWLYDMTTNTWYKN